MDNAYIHMFRRKPERRELGLPGHPKAANVLVFVDVRAAVAHGIRFYESTGDTKADQQVRMVCKRFFAATYRCDQLTNASGWLLEKNHAPHGGK